MSGVKLEHAEQSAACFCDALQSAGSSSAELLKSAWSKGGYVSKYIEKDIRSVDIKIEALL